MIKLMKRMWKETAVIQFETNYRPGKFLEGLKKTVRIYSLEAEFGTRNLRNTRQERGGPLYCKVTC
jgi:hypothetical protein